MIRRNRRLPPIIHREQRKATVIGGDRVKARPIIIIKKPKPMRIIGRKG